MDRRYWLALGLAVASYGIPRSLFSGLSTMEIRYELFADAFAQITMVLAIAFLAASLYSHVRHKFVFSLDGSRQDLDTMRALPWERFQLLLRDLFRDYGHRVEEQRGCAAYERPDLVVRKDGRSAILHCGLWKQKRVDVASVRKLFSRISAGRADEVILVSTGEFTPEAWAFAEGRPLRLLDGDELRYLIRCARAAPPAED
jgi:restriction system protein